jgi:hypothetical protein
MPRALRNTLAVLAGAAVSMLLVAVGDMLLRQIWPIPSGYGEGGMEELAAALRTLPPAPFAMAVAYWSVASAAGALVATRLSAGRKLWAGLIVAGILTAASVANLAMLWHPAWMWPATIVLVPGAGWLASRSVVSRATVEGDVASHRHVHA